VSDSRRWVSLGAGALLVAAAFVFLIVTFQTNGRYRYETIGGVQWRIDEITNRRCRVVGQSVDCSPPKSTSVSTSTSTSTSLSVTTVVRHRSLNR
jgi:hypothetical protein